MKKTFNHFLIFAGILVASVGHSATISFSQLALATPDDSYGTGPGFNTTFSTPGSGNDQSDFTFQFTFTMPTTLTTGNTVLVDFGGATVGTALWLENDRLVFRAANSGGSILYLTSNALSASTQYEVTSSILINDSGDDEAQLFLNGVSGVDTGFLNHQPVADINDDWTGGNGSGYGEIGGGMSKMV